MKFSFVDKVKDGKVPKIRQGIAEALAYFEGKDVEVEIKKWSGRKSRQLEKYYWGIVLKIAEEYTGHTRHELHEINKAKHLPKRVQDPQTGKDITVVGSTQDLSYEEHVEFVEAVKRDYADMVYIPDPGEDYEPEAHEEGLRGVGEKDSQRPV